ncbi:MAG: hypothetical protein FWF31_01295 [Desulfobulbus sp.]|nr:hypothetical protein [Desulfobulbus sp.]
MLPSPWIGLSIVKGSRGPSPISTYLISGKEGERPFAGQILAPGQTSVCDRGCQDYSDSGQIQAAGKHFVARIKENSITTCIESYPVAPGSIVFSDAKVLLGRKGVNQTRTPLRLAGYKLKGASCWIAASRYDLGAEQIARIYMLRW